MVLLAIVDRGYRGTAEAQFFDALYGLQILGPGLGGVHVVLRDTAVCTAVAGRDPDASFRVGSLSQSAVPSSRSVQGLLRDGVRVTVDEPDLHRLGFTCADLFAGVDVMDTNELAPHWASYSGVWFL